MRPTRWPDPVNRAFKHMNRPSRSDARVRVHSGWARFQMGSRRRPPQLPPPLLLIGARYDPRIPPTWSCVEEVPKGPLLFCPNGPPSRLYDEPSGSTFDGTDHFYPGCSAKSVLSMSPALAVLTSRRTWPRRRQHSRTPKAARPHTKPSAPRLVQKLTPPRPRDKL